MIPNINIFKESYVSGGPYEVDIVLDNDTIKLKTIDEDRAPFVANGHRVKVYQKLVLRDSFVQQVAIITYLKVVATNAVVFPSTSTKEWIVPVYIYI